MAHVLPSKSWYLSSVVKGITFVFKSFKTKHRHKLKTLMCAVIVAAL